MADRPALREPEENTTFLLEQAADRLQDRILRGVVDAGYDVRPAHTAVFTHIDSSGTRLTHMAERARMTPQAMAELVDDLARRGYVDRVPDPTDGRAKLIVLTDRGYDAVQAALDTIIGIETDLAEQLGRAGLLALRRALHHVGDPPAPHPPTKRPRERKRADENCEALLE